MIQTRNPAAASPYPYYPTSFHALRHILQVEGASGLYRGFFSSLITYMPSSAIWWASNALARRHLNYWIYGDAGGLQQPEDDEQEGHPWNEMDLPPRLLSRPPRDLAVLALSGIFAGLTSAMLTNPLDVLKTRIQTSALPFSTVLKNLLATEGPWGLARGVRARMLSTVPTSTLLIFSYEVVKSLSVRVD